MCLPLGPTCLVLPRRVVCSHNVSSFPDIFRRAAPYVDRILRGANAGELPVQLPTKYQLVVNLKTAKTLGLTIPESFLLRADDVIE